MADNRKKKRKKSTMEAAAQKMVVGGTVNIQDEEELITPFQMAVNNFRENIVAMTGLVLFVVI